MADPTYSLAWPRQLFVWEANRILKLPTGEQISRAISPLLEEAFEDPEVALTAGFSSGAWGIWPDSGESLTASLWIQRLLVDEPKLLPYVEPSYWSERHDPANEPVEALRVSLATDFIGLLHEMRERGYFPRALPKPCVDDWPEDSEVTRQIQRATKLAVTWPIEDPDKLSEGALYSLIEYFNDQAQRPRTYSFHTYGECGAHYADHNRESGGAVYRWRVNQILRAHGVGLRLGAIPPERGRLVRHFDSPLDDLAEAEVSGRVADPHDEVAHAIRDFRKRGAGLPQKRSALALLAGALEARRQTLKSQLGKADERDLFMVANNFMIRHRNDHQQTDYGEEFLDWIFWNYLATVQLIEKLESRS